MDRAIVRSTQAVLLLASILTTSASAQNGSIAGMWSLVSSVVEKDGTRIDQFGTGVKGMMSLDAGGHFMLTIIGSDLPKFASGNRAAGTAEENKAVMSKSIAMIGTYVFNPEAKTLIFNTERASFPNWDATEQKRLVVTANGQELKYITSTASSGGVGTVTWKRAE